MFDYVSFIKHIVKIDDEDSLGKRFILSVQFNSPKSEGVLNSGFVDSVFESELKDDTFKFSFTNLELTA
jgi:hypothetical protein